jgi:CheY-like chemotaxis protein
VDDAADTLEFICEVLRIAKVDVTAAGSVDEALKLFDEARPQIVISDIAMPERDGFDLLHAVRDLGPARNGDVPMIALTAYARDEDRQRALMAGFQQHLTKPIEPAAIVAAVTQVAGGHRHNVAINGGAS